MSWADFDVASALERDVLSRALPILPPSGTYARATYDTTVKGTQIALGVTDSVGLTPEGCIEQLALRPLFVGAAWKVLDLLYEEALRQRGIPPDRRGQYSVAAKQRRARRGTARPPEFAVIVWRALMALYANTVDLRHSLVHRSVRTDASQSLIGVAESGRAIRPLTVGEQEAFARAALAAAMVALGGGDTRDEARLLGHLGVLAAVHRRKLAAAVVPRVVPVITVVVDPDAVDHSRYPLDVPAIRSWLPFPDSRDFVDMTVVPRHRSGRELRGRLEDAPDAVLLLDLDDPPAWLT